MQYIDIRGTSQENIAKEVEEIAKRRGMELEFQVNSSNIISIVGGFLNLFCLHSGVSGYLAFP